MNKNVFVAIAALTFSAASFAQSTANTSAAGTASANGGVNVFAPNETSTVRYATSSAFAPPLAATEPCMGSTSMGATAMSWGVAFGSTWSDPECELLKKADTEWNMNQHIAAISTLCTDDDMRYSIQVSGGVMDKRADGAIIRIGCPMTKEEWIAAGRPLINPETGMSVASGTVVVAAPPPTPVTVSSVDALGVKETITSQPRL
jgi:hypothetical protein